MAQVGKVMYQVKLFWTQVLSVCTILVLLLTVALYVVHELGALIKKYPLWQYVNKFSYLLR